MLHSGSLVTISPPQAGPAEVRRSDRISVLLAPAVTGLIGAVIAVLLVVMRKRFTRTRFLLLPAESADSRRADRGSIRRVQARALKRPLGRRNSYAHQYVAEFARGRW